MNPTNFTLLTDEQLNVLCAEACELVAVSAGTLSVMVLHKSYIVAAAKQRVEKLNESHLHLIPNFCASLDACRAGFETRMADEERGKYCDAICKLLLAGSSVMDAEQLVFLTERQRVIAFLTMKEAKG